MAFIKIKFFSKVLGMSSEMNVILPEVSGYDKPVKFQTLYLLHGGTDDNSAWMRYTSIERYASQNVLAVVMPAADLSYYTDMAKGRNYWTYITEEVPKISRMYFPLSDKREDNFVAGLSMGGYGAFKWALKKPETVAAAASFSGVMDIKNLLSKLNPVIKSAREKQFDYIFGDHNNIPDSEDLLYLADEAKKNGKELPKLFQCCGTEDFTYPLNIKFRDHAMKLGIDIHYEEGHGTHEWGYWDASIQKALEWFPLKRAAV